MDPDGNDFTIVVDEFEDGARVRVRGDLDLATVPTLRACLLELAHRNVTIDCSELTFLDSTAIGVLVSTARRRADDGGTFVLRAVPRAPRRILELMGVLEVLHVEE